VKKPGTQPAARGMQTRNARRMRPGRRPPGIISGFVREDPLECAQPRTGLYTRGIGCTHTYRRIRRYEQVRTEGRGGPAAGLTGASHGPLHPVSSSPLPLRAKPLFAIRRVRNRWAIRLAREIRRMWNEQFGRRVYQSENANGDALRATDTLRLRFLCEN